MKMLGFRTQSAGFTIIELLVAMLASSIVVLIVGNILVFSWRGWRMNSDSVKMQQDMSLMMRMIAKEVREASFDEIQDGVDILDCGGIQFVKNDTDLTYKGVQLVNGWVGSFQSTKIVSNQSVRVDVELNTATDISKISADFFTRN